MMRNVRFKILLMSMALGLSYGAMAQLVTNNNAPFNDPQYLVQNILVGSGVTTSNWTLTGSPVSIGFFDGTNSNIGIDSGIVITTGSTLNAHGPNTQSGTTGNNGTPGNALLSSVSGFNTYDAAILQFDFVPLSDTLRFNYVFGSEEYPEFVGGSVNDVFGFFLTGPDPAGGNYTDENIALIPGTSIPITINDVNCQANSPFYVCNDYPGLHAINPCVPNYTCATSAANTTVEYDGFTTVLTAEAPVICGQTYVIKMAIADAGDGILDSGVFLEAGSFTSPSLEITPFADLSNSPNDTALIEGCGNPSIEVTRSGNLSDTLFIPLNVGGTATSGVDFQPLPDTLVILPGVTSMTYSINIYYDNIVEGSEILVLYTDPITTECFTYDPVQIFLTILDQPDVTLAPLADQTVICPGDTVDFQATASGGFGHYVYTWENGLIDSLRSVAPLTTTTYAVEATDTCGNQLIVDSVTVFVDYDSIVLSHSPDGALCLGDSLELFAQTSGGGGNLVYDWGAGVADSTFTVAPTMDTLVTIQVMDDCGSMVDAQIFISVNDYAQADFNSQASGYFTSSFLNLSSGSTDFTWQFGDGTSSTAAEPTHTYANAGTYPVTLIASTPLGCNDTLTRFVDVFSELYFYMPNAFTPNLDGQNDYYAGLGEGFESYSMEIFNRWGELLFTSNFAKLSNGVFGTPWDGNFKGEPAPAGVYMYRAEVVPALGAEPLIETGYFTLIR